MLSLDQPATLPTELECTVARDAAAVIAAQYTARMRVREAAYRSRFGLTPAQRRLIPTVARYQQNAWAEVFSAYYVGLELAVACTTTQLESTGRNIYGADPASAWMNNGPYGRLWGAAVTRANYLWFGSMVDRGMVSNGVGPKQLTSRGLQKAADVRGGCWDPQHNCAEGDVFFLALMRQTGSVWSAAYAYNGSGPAAQRYANNFVSLVAVWRTRVP